MDQDKALEVLKKGGLVIAPSDTVYGALVDATNEEAVKKLIEFKARPAGKAISVFVSDLKMLQEHVEADKNQLKTLEKLLPGPFTVVLKSKGPTSSRLRGVNDISKLLESEDGTLGVRIPDYKFINDLVKKFGRPITATSANISGKSAVYSIDALMKQLSQKKKDLIDLVVNAGKLPRNKPSTVIDLTKPEIRVIRKGDIDFKNEQSFTSNSDQETKEIAKKILESSRQTRTIKPLIFIIEGDLGVGKTIFVKGIGEALGIKDIISPTFVIYYEYLIKTGKLIHVDLYNLEKEEEFKHLGLEKYLKVGNIFAIEWGEKSTGIIKLLKKAGTIVKVEIRYLGKNKREIRWLS